MPLQVKGVHVVTVNEYLTERDATEMGELYSWLGLSVGINLAAKSPMEKKEAYLCDITYQPTQRLVSTTFVTTWSFVQKNWCKTIRVTTAFHGTTCKLVDNQDFLLFTNHIVDIENHDIVGTEGIVNKVSKSHIFQCRRDFLV